MKDLLESRKEIDEIDDSIIRLFEKRMEVLYNLTNVYEIFYFKEDLCI